MQIDRNDARNFNNLIGEMGAFVGAEGATLAKNTARDMGFALVGVTPAARKGTKNRGFAKQGWIEVLKKLGKSPRANFPGVSNSAKDMSDVVVDTKRDVVSYELTNATPFIEDLDNGTGKRKPVNALPKAVKKTSVNLAKRLDRMGKRASAKWNR